MKLTVKSGTYLSPKINQGTFAGAFVEDIAINHRRRDHYLSVTFGLCYEQDGQVRTLAKANLIFFGLENEIGIPGKTSNQASWVDVPNPDYDPDFVGDENTTAEEYDQKTLPYFRKNLIDYLAANNGELGANDVIVDYGYPTYERVMDFFQGGNIDNPELIVSNPIAIGFLLSKLIINSESVGQQFELVV